jgi:hypothetical protein
MDKVTKRELLIAVAATLVGSFTFYSLDSNLQRIVTEACPSSDNARLVSNLAIRWDHFSDILRSTRDPYRRELAYLSQIFPEELFDLYKKSVE